jgi:predicted DNA-binding transcriptional regulator AlpA
MTDTPADPVVSPRPTRVLDRHEVMARVKLSYPTILNRIRRGLFPPPRNDGYRNLWLEHEIAAYLEALPVQPHVHVPPPPPKGEPARWRKQHEKRSRKLR